MHDATDDGADDAPYVDHWVFTPDCGPHSSRNHVRSPREQAAALAMAAKAFRYAHRVRPLSIVVENVNEPGVVAGITAIVTSLTGYAWKLQILDSLTHAGVPVKRERAFWVGVRVQD